MPTYSLDRSNDLYVGCPAGPINPSNLVFFRRFNDNGCNINCTEIAKLDPRKNDDVLTVYGTEIKGNLLRKLANATQLRNLEGSLAVNCHGSTIFGVCATNRWYKTIDDVIFDWSAYGVTVPGSDNDSLKRQLKQKERLNEELRRQLLDKQSVEDHLKKRLCVTEEELKSSQKQLDEVKKTLVNLKDRLSSFEAEDKKHKSQEGLLEFIKQEYADCKKQGKDKDYELQNLRDQLSALKCELKLAKAGYEE